MNDIVQYVLFSIKDYYLVMVVYWAISSIVSPEIVSELLEKFVFFHSKLYGIFLANSVKKMYKIEGP